MTLTEEVIYALKEIERLKGKERAIIIEKMLRLETNHFRSQQFKLTKSAGMEYGKWQNLNEDAFTTIKMKDNHLTGEKQMRTFIKWNSVLDFCLYLSDYIDRHNGNYGRWNSMKEEKQAKYRATIGLIKNRIII